MDVTVPAFNTIRQLYEGPPGARTFRHELAVAYLRRRWLVENGPSSPSPFWLSVPGSPEPIALADLVVFLIAESVPGQDWVTVRDPNVWPLTIGERSLMLHAVATAARDWTMENGRLHPGLDEILAIFGALITQMSQRLDLLGDDEFCCLELIETLIDDLRTFAANWIDVPTLTDLGRAFDMWTQFALGLAGGEQLGDRDFASQLLKLGQHARILLRMSVLTDGDRGRPRDRIMNLLDGSLLPWSIAADNLDPEMSYPPTLVVARDRFADTLPTLGRRLRPRFLLDYDFDADANVPDPSESEPKGWYSMAHAIALGRELTHRLGGFLGVEPAALSTPVVIEIDAAWTAEAPQQKLTFEELVG